MKKMILILITLFFVFSYKAIFGGDIINVPEDHPTIQEGIIAAINGDTILVKPGTYVENINFNGKNIVIGSLFLSTDDTSYISQTIIDGNQNGSVVTFENGEDSLSILNGFKITNGFSLSGGGIYIRYSSPKIINCLITGNSSKNDSLFSNSGGGGLHNFRGSPTILNCTFTNNSVLGVNDGGGGIYNYFASPIIKYCSFINNSAECSGCKGGAISNYNTYGIIEDCVFKENFANNSGGISCEVCQDIINRCVFIRNRATQNISTMPDLGFAGGIFTWYGSPKIMKCIFIENHANSNGGGIVNGRSSPFISNCTFVNNTANRGGAIYNDFPNTYPIVRNCIIWFNTVTDSGCSVYNNNGGCNLNISYTNIEGGVKGIININGATITDCTGIISSNPNFKDVINSDFTLKSNSPCIDTGDPDLNGDGLSWENDLDDQDPDGTRMDMGSYYFSQEVKISISVDSVYAFKNDTIIVGVNVDFPTDSTFSSFELGFGGFQGSLEFIEVDTSNSLIGTVGWDVYVNDTDTLLITASGGSNDISGEGTLFRLKFYVPDTLSTGLIPITVEHVLFDETDLYVNIVNGGVNILNPTFYGDVSLNSEVHAYDASLILKYLIGIEELNTQQLLNANVSLDNSVSALDASLIFQYVVGLIDTLPYDTTMESLLASGNIGMNNGKIQSSQQIDVPLLLIGGENILSFEGLIKFNPEHLAFNGIVWSDLLDDFTIELNEDNGNIKIAGAGSVPDGQEGLFATIHFTVDDNFNEAETLVEVKKLRWNEEAVVENVASAILTNTVGINGDQSNIPKEYALQQSFPNPFNPTTTIVYQLPKSSFVKLAIYDVNGRLIEKLVNENKNAGYYTVGWNASQVCSGIYFYRIDAGEFTCVKKCLVVK